MSTFTFYRSVLFFRSNLSTAEKRDIRNRDKIHKSITSSGFSHIPSFSDNSSGSIRQKCGMTYMVHNELKHGKKVVGRPVSVIVHSQEKPRWNDLPHYIDVSDVRVTEESLDISPGQTLRFESVVTPVKQVRDENGSARKLYLAGHDEVGEWVQRNLESRELDPVKPIFVQDVFYWADVQRGNGAEMHFPARGVSGTVMVNNPEKVKELLLNGWGKCKAYGSGMVLAQNVEV